MAYMYILDGVSSGRQGVRIHGHTTLQAHGRSREEEEECRDEPDRLTDLKQTWRKSPCRKCRSWRHRRSVGIAGSATRGRDRARPQHTRDDARTGSSTLPAESERVRVRVRVSSQSIPARTAKMDGTRGEDPWINSRAIATNWYGVVV